MGSVNDHYLEGYDPLSSRMAPVGDSNFDYTGRQVGTVTLEDRNTLVGNVASDLIRGNPMARSFNTGDNVSMHVALIALIALGVIVGVRMLGFRTIIAVGD